MFSAKNASLSATAAALAFGGITACIIGPTLFSELSWLSPWWIGGTGMAAAIGGFIRPSRHIWPTIVGSATGLATGLALLAIAFSEI